MILINDNASSKRKLRPFDSASLEDFPLYNHFPYYRDIDLCPAENITLISGNIVKYFQYTLKETFPLKNMDALAQSKIKEYQKREALKDENITSADIEYEETEEEPGAEAALEESSEKESPAYLDMDFE